MTPKSIIILGAATVIAVGAAAVSLNANQAGTGVEVSGPVFPGLIEQVNTIAKVVIEHRGQTLTMVRAGKDGWTMAESDSYPVSAKVAEKVVVQLADLNFYELKTKKPELYSRLHVEDLGAKDSQARQIKLFDAGGKAAADLMAGRKRYNLVGTRKEGVYIRKPGNAQTWLAAGELDVEIKPGDWLVSKIVDIAEEKVAKVTIRHPDGEKIAISKPDPKVRNFTLHGIPMGKQLKYDTDPNNVAAVLDQLNLDDARKAGFVTFDADKTINSLFETRDGLTLEIAMVAKGEEQWASFKASTMEGAKPGAVKLADEINKRVTGWVYALPSFKSTRLKRRMADMLKDNKPAS
ncbi:MAG: DUF4340 domain-containing protein [Rhodospirillaceae bacterium]|jgi:hypothetical protein|nr:DUF4340 domain-containing protein [Rhodospirillaceae bacterium]